MPLHMQNDIQKHMQLLLMQQKEVDEKMLSLEAYHKAKEPTGSFLWAIDNWLECAESEGPQLILSRKFQFAGKLSMRLQMVVVKDDDDHDDDEDNIILNPTKRCRLLR